MFAMKYMNKNMCIKNDAIHNVLREIEILTTLEHPFLVNLWFTFQDQEDMFMVVDLLLGGDLRYHIQQEVNFVVDDVRLYICEIGMALDYLQSNHIVHRDIKPDNILMDEGGHVHITDFNIATVLKDGQLATSLSGTKPYMAPEVYACALEECPGYSFQCDWWSLGVCAYETLRGRTRGRCGSVCRFVFVSYQRCGMGVFAERSTATHVVTHQNVVAGPAPMLQRPYDIHTSSSMYDIKHMFTAHKQQYPTSWKENLRDLLRKLLCIDPDERICNLETLKNHSFISSVDLTRVLKQEVKPTFVPSNDHLNCDPTYELEEMIIESKPLHKKKKRLAKQNSKRERNSQSSVDIPDDPMQACLEAISKDFKLYNRERKLAKEDIKGNGKEDVT